jgi:hypothetical protein
MKDIPSKLELFLTEANDCELIAGLATESSKRELFRHLADRFREMAAQLARSTAFSLVTSSGRERRPSPTRESPYAGCVRTAGGVVDSNLSD